MLRGIVVTVGLTVWGYTSVVAASPQYPTRLQREMGTQCAPRCTVCHDSNNGGTDTVHSAFGQTLMKAGLTRQNPEGLLAVLAKLEQQDVDTNRDGAGDVGQLRRGLDPNDGSPLCDVSPTCSTSQRGSPPPAGLGALAIAGMLAAVVGWRRRRRS